MNSTFKKVYVTDKNWKYKIYMIAKVHSIIKKIGNENRNYYRDNNAAQFFFFFSQVCKFYECFFILVDLMCGVSLKTPQNF